MSSELVNVAELRTNPALLKLDLYCKLSLIHI